MDPLRLCFGWKLDGHFEVISGGSAVDAESFPAVQHGSRQPGGCDHVIPKISCTICVLVFVALRPAQLAVMLVASWAALASLGGDGGTSVPDPKANPKGEGFRSHRRLLPPSTWFGVQTISPHNVFDICPRPKHCDAETRIVMNARSLEVGKLAGPCSTRSRLHATLPDR